MTVLLSLKYKNQDCNFAEMEIIKIISDLPLVFWKIINLKKTPTHKHKEAYNKLENILYQRSDEKE